MDGIPAVIPNGAVPQMTDGDAADIFDDAAWRADPAEIAELEAPAADPFGRITEADRARAAAIPAGAADAGDDAEITMMPCPDVVPGAAHFRFGDLPTPSRIWVYRDAGGAALAVVARYDGKAADGSPTKQVRPWTYGRRIWTDRAGKPQDRTGWHAKAPPAPCPIYGLDRLHARQDVPVLVAEGEKAADAAGQLFPDMVCVTSQGGANAAGKSDWTPLRGRRVTIWPDQDKAGADYAEAVAELVRLAGAASVRIVEVPGDWPAGWDLADALPEGVPPARLRELLDDAPDGIAAEYPGGFKITPKGLFFYPEPTEKNPEPAPVFVAAPFRVIGQTRSDIGEAWGVFLRWRDREGRRHQWAIPRRMIHRAGAEISEELENAGLSCGADHRAHDLLKRFIGGVRIARMLTCVTRTGWHQSGDAPVFVLPGGEAFGRGAADTILQTDQASRNDAYGARGTLAGWQAKVAALAVGNDRLALFTAAAFAGPLLDLIDEPSGGVHLWGIAQTGKTTAARLAASVWGKPAADGQLRQWRGTANGLEGAAAETSDALLILDEMSQADAREVADVVYMLANSGGKQRASRTGSARQRATWRTLFLSTGEITLAAKMGEAGKRALAGLEVRLISLPADAGAGHGVLQNLHGRASAAALIEELRGAALAHHGTPARAFLARLAQDRADRTHEIKKFADDLRGGFLARHVPAGASGQVRSVASRFALIAAAGELARDYGVLPWPPGEAMRAAGACFNAWLGGRGGAGASEDALALAQVRAFLEAHGASRFTPLMTQASGGDPVAPDGERTINRAGFRRRPAVAEGGEGWEYLILPQVWQGEVCKGLDAKRTADLLAARGWLLGSTERHRAARVNIPGEGKRRVYVVSGAILAADDTPEGGIGGPV